MMYHYTIKALQLYFICTWQEAKMSKTSFETLQKFQRLRYVIEPRTYFIGLGIVVTLCTVPIVYAVSARDFWMSATNGYQTLRCEWWNIPGVAMTLPSSVLCLDSILRVHLIGLLAV